MAKDFFHELVKTVLVNDGWRITHDPYELPGNDPDWEIDLGAEKLIAATQDVHKIAVEVKSYLETSFSYEFHRIIGQYLNYRLSLQHFEPDRLLFLSVPLDIYETHFNRPAIVRSIKSYSVHLLIYDPLTKSLSKNLVRDRKGKILESGKANFLGVAGALRLKNLTPLDFKRLVLLSEGGFWIGSKTILRWET